MATLTLRPQGITLDAPRDKDLLTIMREAGVYVKSSCGGHATCSDCIIKIVSGEDNLTPPPFGEIQLLGNVFHITKERLSCQTYLTGDATIDISGHDKARDEGRRGQKPGPKRGVVRRPGGASGAAGAETKRRDFSRPGEPVKDVQEDLGERGFDKGPKKLGGGKRPKRRPY